MQIMLQLYILGCINCKAEMHLYIVVIFTIAPLITVTVQELISTKFS